MIKVVSTAKSLKRLCMTDLIDNMSRILVGLPQDTSSHECEDWHDTVDYQFRKNSS